MTDQPEDFRQDRRRALQLLGGTVGGLMLAPYGCSRSDDEALATRFEAPPIANGYRFIQIVTPNTAGFDGLNGLTPGVMFSDNGAVVFYAPIRAEDAYALFKLELDFSKETPAIRNPGSVVRTGQELPGGQQVRRILIADINASGKTAFVADGFAKNNGENVVEQAPTLIVHDGPGRYERILGLSDRAPDGGSFGAAMGDVDITDEDNLFIVSAFATESRDVEQGVFHLPGASLSDARILAQSGQALRGTDSVNQSFGLIDARDQGDYVLQSHIQDAGMLQAAPGTSQSILFQGNASAPPGDGALLSGQQLFGAGFEDAGTGEVLLGPRSGISKTAAWVEHYGEATDTADQPQALFYRDGSQTRRIAETGDNIVAFSAPVLSGNGQLFYMQINRQDNPGMELRVTNGAEIRTILARGQKIDGKTVTSMLYGYHSEQADNQGRVVVYAELDDEPVLLLGIPV